MALHVRSPACACPARLREGGSATIPASKRVEPPMCSGGAVLHLPLRDAPAPGASGKTARLRVKTGNRPRETRRRRWRSIAWSRGHRGHNSRALSDLPIRVRPFPVRQVFARAPSVLSDPEGNLERSPLDPVNYARPFPGLDSHFSNKSRATFLPDSNMPPKMGPMRGPPNVAFAAIPATYKPGNTSPVF